jgi:hypothetical protein
MKVKNKSPQRPAVYAVGLPLQLSVQSGQFKWSETLNH